MIEWGAQNYPEEFRLGNVKAVKFKGKYYKFDFEQDPSIVNWMFDSFSGSKDSMAIGSSSKKNPTLMANKFLNQENF